MNTHQKGTLAWLRNVQGFLERHHITMDGVEIAPAKKQLEELLAELTAQAVTQGGAALQARTQTVETHRLRRHLLARHLRRIVRTAHTINSTSAEGTFPTFAMPAKRLDDERLASAAEVMADSVEPLADQFVARGLSADFVSRLRAAAAALLESRKQRSKHVSQRSGATQGVRDRDVRARRIIRLIDAFVGPEIQDDPVLSTEWRTAVRKPVTVKGASPAAGDVATKVTAA